MRRFGPNPRHNERPVLSWRDSRGDPAAWNFVTDRPALFSRDKDWRRSRKQANINDVQLNGISRVNVQFRLPLFIPYSLFFLRNDRIFSLSRGVLEEKRYRVATQIRPDFTYAYVHGKSIFAKFNRFSARSARFNTLIAASLARGWRYLVFKFEGGKKM